MPPRLRLFIDATSGHCRCLDYADIIDADAIFAAAVTLMFWRTWCGRVEIGRHMYALHRLLFAYYVNVFATCHDDGARHTMPLIFRYFSYEHAMLCCGVVDKSALLYGALCAQILVIDADATCHICYIILITPR